MPLESGRSAFKAALPHAPYVLGGTSLSLLCLSFPISKQMAVITTPSS